MKKKRFFTTFTKMIFFFVVFGLLPLLLLSILFFCRYTDSIRKTSVSNYSQIVSYFSKNVSDVLEGADEAMGALYDYQNQNGDSLSAVLKSDSISESDRNQQVAAALQDVMSQSEYIASERFVDKRGNFYSLYRDQGKTLKNNTDYYTNMTIVEGENLRKIKLLGTTQESNICVNSDDFIFVLVRNFMDT